MAVITLTPINLPDGHHYIIEVSGTIDVGSTFTITANTGIIAQYTAVPGDTVASVVAALYASTTVSKSGLTSTGYAVFLGGNTIISTAVTNPPPPPTPLPPVVITATGLSVTYGKRFQVSFDPPGGGSAFFKPRYRLDILQKNYSGNVTSLTGGPSGVRHSWQTDEAKPAIKGSSLTAGILNEGSLPLSTFYSIDDDEFKLQLYWLEVGLLGHTTDRLLFEGYLIIDSCSEILVNYIHEIELSANDSLGLLKSVALDKAPASYEILFSSTEPYEITLSGINTIVLVSTAFGDTLQIGDKISIDSGPLYTIKDLIAGSGIWNVYLVEHPATVSSTTGIIAVYRSSLLEKVTILSIIKRCLSATNLQLNTNIYCNLWEENQVNTSSFLAQTLVDASSFLKDSIVYDDCYSILQKILERFGLTLFQAEGVWNIVRWDELRYYANNIPGFSYDEDFNLIGAIALPDALQIDRYDPAAVPETYPETGLLNMIFGSFLFSKEKYDFKQPPHILRDDDLQILGNDLRHYTTGTQGIDLKKISEYDLPWWYQVGTTEFFIRVVKDEFDTELERYIVLKGGDSIKSYRIEASKGDKFDLNFTISLDSNYVNGATWDFVVELTDGIQTKYISNYVHIPLTPAIAEYWGDAAGWTYTLDDPNSDNHSVTIPGPRVPFDGLIYIYLKSVAIPGHPGLETRYKDIRFEYTALINNSVKIIGQIHKSEQVANIKQKEETDISVDDSPRNFIGGTLFLDQKNGVIQKRTSQWHRDHIPLEKRKIGNITTGEQLQWRNKARTILEGSFIGLLHENKSRHVSMLSVFRCSVKAEIAELNFVFGKLEIDYKNDRITNSTLWEIYKDLEPDIVSDYEFKYLYDTK